MTDTNTARSAPSPSGRITLDLDRLIAAGKMTRDEATRLAAMADAQGARHTLANVLLIFGAIMTVVGVLAFQPPLEVGLALAIGAIVLGALLIRRTASEWGLLGQALVLMGALGLSGWMLMRFPDLPEPLPQLAWPAITLLTLAGAIAFRNAVLAALVPIAIGYMLGGGTAYWHASYGIFMQEPTLSILVFGGMATAYFFVRNAVPASHELVGVIMARVCFFLGNFGFWIGSLWGDYPGQLWRDLGAADPAWRETALFIPPAVFSLLWAAAMIAALIAGIKAKRRFVANTAIVFLAIHLYTQLFELLIENPFGLLLSGIVLIALGFGIVRFDGWLRGREKMPKMDTA